MSHFKLQRIANQFPLWTKTRSDPSSMGQRLLSTFASYFDFAEAEMIRFRDEGFVNKWHLGHEALWSIWLEEEDYLATVATVGGGLAVTYPVDVEATHESLGSITLLRESDFADLLYGVPQRLELKETITINNLDIWTSLTPETFNSLSYPERLTINVSGSTKYNRKTALEDRLHSGFNGMIVTGKDINGLETKEKIDIRDDGVYTTRTIWSRIAEQPLIDGFNGSVTLGYKQANLPYVLDPYHIGVLQDVEGPLKLRLIKEAVEGEDEITETVSFLEYFTDRFKLGSAYRSDPQTINNEESIGKTVLLDSSGEHYDVVDLAISYENAKLYVLDSDGYIHVYEHGLSPFSPPKGDLKQTSSTRIVPQPLQHYVAYGATESMWTFHKNPRNLIESVEVRRIKPDGTVEYLQDDLSWGLIVYSFSGELKATVASNSWNDLSFSVEYDQLGQWDFFIKVEAEGESTVAHTAVMVDSTVAEISIDSEIDSPTGLFFSREGCLTICDSVNFYKFTEHRDSYFADAERQQLIFRETYTSVEVST